MERYAGFENSASRARIERLTSAERDLQARIDAQVFEAEAAGRWVSSDPMYQYLVSALRQVRIELCHTEQEHLRYTATPRLILATG